jgi:hypothetical protein
MSNAIVERKSRTATLLRLPMFRYAGALAALGIIATIVLPLWRLFPEIYGLPVIPLHYNIHYGVDWTGAWWQIFALPAMGIVFFLINTGIALFFVRRNELLTNVALSATVLLSALLFAAMVFVVSLNIVYG